jgi:hypothetical protein
MSPSFAASEPRKRLPRQHPQLRVVEQQAVAPLDRLQQVVPRGLDPEVHRVERDEGCLLALFAHLTLQGWLDVREEQQVTFARLLGELRLEVAKDA